MNTSQFEFEVQGCLTQSNYNFDFSIVLSSHHCHHHEHSAQ